MRLQRAIALLFAAMLAMACIPALAQTYSTECENILAPADNWTVCPGNTDGAVSQVTRLNATDPYAYGGSGLKIVDNRTADDTGKLLIRGVSTFPFGGSATAVVRMKTTADQAFSALKSPLDASGPWGRSFILIFTTATPGDLAPVKRAIGLAVRPDSAMVVNSSGLSVYGSAIPGDNTHFVTWTIVGQNHGNDFEIYRDGVLVSSGSTNSSPEPTLSIGSPNGGLDGYDGVVLASTPNITAGSWIFDRVAYKAGADPTWQPWAAPTGSVSGVISKVGDPSVKIGDARVVLRKGQSIVATTATASDGTYSFAGVDPEQYTVTVSADGYFSKSTVVVVASAAVTANLGLSAVPKLGNLVYDDFDTDPGELTATKDAQQLPWVKTSAEVPGGSYYSGGTLSLYGSPLAYPCGVSIGEGFAPANVDISVDVQQTGFLGGILYRQTLPCVYDTYSYNGTAQTAAQAGYLVFVWPELNTVALFRNGKTIASVNPSLNWSEPHKLRVIAYGNYHEVLIDGQRAISANDSGKLTGGYVGLVRYTAPYILDNFNVQPLTAGSSLGTISGSVYDAAVPSTKLLGATVWLVSGTAVLGSSVADANGNYSLSVPSLSQLTLITTMTNYNNKTVVFESVFGSNTVNIAMDRDATYRATAKAAKASAVGTEVFLAGKIITASWSGNTMYIEEPNRSSGIKVTLPTVDSSLATKIRKTVDVRGILRADAATGELYIQGTTVTVANLAKVAFKPVLMNGRTVLDKASGADVTGLDAKVVGKVTAVNSPTDFTINDGSGDLKVVVDPVVGLDPWPAIGDFVDAEGIISLDGASPQTAARCVRLWTTNANWIPAEIAGYESTNPITGWTFEDYTGGVGKLTWDTTNPHSGTTCAHFVSTAGYGSGIYMQIWRDVPGPIWDDEYEVSCWVRGAGVVSAGMTSQMSDWGSWEMNLPSGDYGWTKFATNFIYKGSNWSSARDMLNFLVRNNCTELAVDDWCFRNARGSIHILEPAP